MTSHARATTAYRALFWLLCAVTLWFSLPGTAAAGQQAATQNWRLPLPGSAEVQRAFDPPPQKWAAGHRGVDLSADVGTDVLAAGAGVIAFAGEVAGRPVVTVRHGDLRTTYLPVRATVRSGEPVAAGDPIGVLTAGEHCGAGSCLHWGLLRGDAYRDPMALFRDRPARLLPVWGIPPGAPPSASPTASYRPGGDRRAARHRAGHGDQRNATPGRQEEAGDRPHTSAAAAAGAAVATALVAATGVAAHRRLRPPGHGPGARNTR